MAMETTLTWAEYQGMMLELEKLRAELKARDQLLADQFEELRNLRNLLSKSRRETVLEILDRLGPAPAGAGGGQRIPEPSGLSNVRPLQGRRN